jgi:taurine transport system permease protein
LDAIFAGMRTSTSAAWMVVLASEMLGAKSGVGFLIVRGMDAVDLPLVLLSMVSIGIVGACWQSSPNLLERMICPWTRKNPPEAFQHLAELRGQRLRCATR